MRHPIDMALSADIRILSVEKLNEGVVIRFDDKTCAYYSAVLLHQTAAKAEPLDETLQAW